MDTISIGEPLVDASTGPSASAHYRKSLPTGTPVADKGAWAANMTLEDRRERRLWLSQERGRKGLRIMIVTENFLPKVDGVTRTLARLLTHLESEGHECMVLGPETGMVSSSPYGRSHRKIFLTGTYPISVTLRLPSPSRYSGCPAGIVSRS
jgi:hypothetical protein